MANPGTPPIKWRKIFANYAKVCRPNLSSKRKYALLIDSLGGEGQELLEHLPSPTKEEQRGLNEYEVCMLKLDRHFLLKTSTILERYHFGLRAQGKEESVEECITNLRKLASTCKFRHNQEERIRDQFVLRCSNDKVREELWLKDEPPLEEVILVAKRVEHMVYCMKELSKAQIGEEPEKKKEETVCVVKKKTYERTRGEKMWNKKMCYRCGHMGHLANDGDCPAIRANCNTCGRIGH